MMFQKWSRASLWAESVRLCGRQNEQECVGIFLSVAVSSLFRLCWLFRIGRLLAHLITTFTAISTHMGEVIDFDDSRPL